MILLSLYEKRISIERLPEDKVKSLIDSFLSCGWTYNGNSNFNNKHTFASFSWNNEGTPIFPKGYEPSKDYTPIHAQYL